MDARAETIKQIPWKVTGEGRYYFVAEPLIINAAPQTVWACVKNIDEYEQYSNGAVTASLPNGELKVDETIHLVLYRHQCLGKIIPASDERISVLDDDEHIVAWERRLPFRGGTTECYRVLQPLENGTKTRSLIALKIPGFIGFFTHLILKSKIENAFNQVNHGIKLAAEANHDTAVFMELR